MKKQILSFLKIASLSLCSFLCIFWILTIRSNENASWSEGVWFFGIAYALLQNYNNHSGLSFLWLITAIVLGRIALEIPIYILDFGSMAASIIFTISSILGITLASICYKIKHASVFLLSIILMILFNSFVVPAWFENAFYNF